MPCTLYVTHKQCSYPLWFHSFGHKVVFVHGPHPLADGGAGFGHFGYSCWLKLLIVNIRLDVFNHYICNVVLEEMMGRGVKDGEQRAESSRGPVGDPAVIQ